MGRKFSGTVSIFFKLVTFSLLLVIIPVTVLGFIGISNFTATTQARTIAQMETSAENKLDLLQQVVDGVKREAHASSYDQDAISILTIIKDGEADHKSYEISEKRYIVSAHLQDLLNESKGLYENLYFVDYNGVVVADAIGGKSIGLIVNSKDYYIDATKSTEPVVSDVTISLETKKPSMVAAVPVYGEDNKNLLGVFCIAIQYDKLTELIVKKTEGINYNYIILNRQGDVIAHENKNMIFKSNMLKDDVTQKTLFQQMSQGKPGYGFFKRGGADMLMYYTPYKDKIWYVATEDTVSDYMSPINNFKATILLIAVICIAVAAFITYLFSRSISSPLKQLSLAASEIASGNLTQNVKISKSKDEIGHLGRNFAKMAENLRNLISQVGSMGENVASSAEQMTSSSEEVSRVSEQVAASVAELAKGATEQAAASERGNSMITGVINGLGQIAGDMTQSEELVEKVMSTVENGRKSVEFQSVKMNENLKVAGNVSDAVISLEQKSKEIGQILSVIRSISDQTNLLSLNAAIEAARAGEQGRGFAVVAEEIRKLAEQSGASVKKIGLIIKEVQAGVQDTVLQMDIAKKVVNDQEIALSDTIKAFENISIVVAEMSSNVKNVADVAVSLSNNSRKAGDAIGDIAAISEETASGAEEIAASTQEQTSVIHQIADSAAYLSELSGELQKSISRFRF